LAINRLWDGFDVPLMWLWVALSRFASLDVGCSMLDVGCLEDGGGILRNML
jgi:hypothetical protein